MLHRYIYGAAKQTTYITKFLGYRSTRHRTITAHYQAEAIFEGRTYYSCFVSALALIS